jgi:hypothetical protein
MVGKLLIVSTIVVLLLVGSPSHIAGFVIPVVVDSIQREPARWPMADVSEERHERRLPPLTHFDTASPVSIKRRLSRVVTPQLDVSPERVLDRLLVCCATVSRMHSRREVALVTTTRLGRTVRAEQVTRPNCFNDAALAATTPLRRPGSPSTLDNGESSEYAAGKVSQIHAPIVTPIALAFAQDGGEAATGQPASSIGRIYPLAKGTTDTDGDGYHRIALKDLATTTWTHACVVGTLTYHRKQRDGDVHLKVEDAGVFIIAEVIDRIPLPIPRTGSRIEVCGITRYDRLHKWAEIHPALSIRVLTKGTP